jgi:hypothetical protein
MVLAAGCYGGLHGSGALDEGGDTDGATDSGADDGDSGDTDPAEVGGFGRAQLRRLTGAQWRQSVSDLLQIPVDGSVQLDPDLHAELFSTVGASTVRTTQLGVERYEAAALQVAAVAFADADARVQLVGCAPQAPDDPCVETFLGAFGRRAWRRPLTDEELSRYATLASDSAAIYDGDAWRGVELAVAALLQSPNFLYVVELGEPDPDQPERPRYTDWEMAGRLAAFLWNSVPDEALLQAAASSQLTDADGLAAQIERMAADPRARAAAVRFFEEYLHVDQMDALVKDPAAFPAASPELLASMRIEVAKLVEDVVFDQDAGAAELLTTTRTFVDAPLAALYGLPAPDPALVDAEGFAPAELPPDWARSGLLGTAALLSVNARVTRTSPTLRGLFVQKRLLCFDIPPPPDNVDTELPEFEEHVTMRERVAMHLQDQTCSACHQFIDPIGLAMEHFDGIGAHRDDDQGLPLDVTGTLDGADFDGLEQLAETIVQHPNLAGCIARQAYRHATGHRESGEEGDILTALTASFRQADERFLALFVEIAESDGFRFLGPT